MNANKTTNRAEPKLNVMPGHGAVLWQDSIKPDDFVGRIKPYALSFAVSLLFTACGGGASDTNAEATTDTKTTTTTETQGPTEPKSTGTTPTPAACSPAPIAASGYSLVFKGCNAAGAAEYYDKTECVRDNASDLIWEGKSNSGTRANSNVYTNYDNSSAAQKSSGPPSQSEIDASTNSIGFQNAVNDQKLCGFNNWRMPLKTELQSIQQANGKVDANWFPNTTSGFYWSMSLTPSLPANLAIVVNFSSGGFGDFGRETPQAVRLVRH